MRLDYHPTLKSDSSYLNKPNVKSLAQSFALNHCFAAAEDAELCFTELHLVVVSLCAIVVFHHILSNGFRKACDAGRRMASCPEQGDSCSGRALRSKVVWIH